VVIYLAGIESATEVNGYLRAGATCEHLEYLVSFLNTRPLADQAQCLATAHADLPSPQQRELQQPGG